MKKDVIIDADPGIDDALAIAMAVYSNNLNVKLLTSVCGNVTIDKITKNMWKENEKGEKVGLGRAKEISDALKKLWKLGFFKDINIYETSVVNDTINLELSLNELPRLSSAKVKGYKKAKSEYIHQSTHFAPQHPFWPFIWVKII